MLRLAWGTETTSARGAPPLARVSVAGACLLLATALAARARAQDAVALDRFSPTPAGDALFAAPDPTVTGHLAPNVGLVLAFADSPLVLVGSGPEGRTEVGKIVSHQLLAHALGSIACFDQVLVDLDVPLVVSQGGDSPATLDRGYASPRGAAWADIPAGLRWQVLRQRGVLPALAVTSRVVVPTGGPYAGAGVARYGFGLVVGADHGDTAWRASLERRRGDDDATLAIGGSDVALTGGVAWRSARIQLGAELLGATVTNQRQRAFGEASTNLEALFSVRYRWPRLTVGTALGPGLAPGLGTPSYRLVAGVTYALVGPPPPHHGGVRPGPRRTGDPARGPWWPTPDLAPQPDLSDRDGDGVPDEADRCPTIVGTGDGKRAGCPRDEDADGVSDALDRCPQAAGVPGPPERHGCPADTDGDGIDDADDPCPEEAAGPAPSERGCPAGLRRVGLKLIVSEEVRFDSGSARLVDANDGTLKLVAAYLAAHPEIARLAIDGHTDDAGREGANLELSRGRAVAVMRALLALGVDERRLEVRAFGSRQPVATNATAAGRAENRRVEFTVLATTEDGERGWREGPNADHPPEPVPPAAHP